MSYHYSEADIQGMILAGIIPDPDKAPDMEDVLYIQSKHECEKCGGNVKYSRVFGGGVRDYEFTCRECGFVSKDAPLKKKKLYADVAKW